MHSHSDILIIGGGVTGLTTAYFLAQQGVSVTLLDRQQTGREASWAGAGMLPPGNLSNAATAESRLRSYSHDLWKDLSANLKERIGIDNEYRRCGSVEVFDNETEFQKALLLWRSEGIAVEPLDRSDLEHHIPDLHGDVQKGIFLPEFGQVRNPRHLKALTAACHGLGVEIIEHVEHLSLTATRSGMVGASTASRTFAFEKICVTAGSWTSQILAPLGVSLPVAPVRGQIAQLKVSRLPFSCVIEQGKRYIVPRTDGLILVGSTEEYVGFEKRTTAEGIAGLLAFAESLVPELRAAEVVCCWAGLRPGSPDELPFLGRVPDFNNLYVGAGHFRSGLQMSPGTGTILADLLLDREPGISLDGLTVDRESNLKV